MKNVSELGGLMVVTDRIAPTRAPTPRTLREVIPLIVPVLQREGGSIQLRDKAADQDKMITLGKQIRDMAPGVPIIVNDDPEVAAAIGADGIHVGQKDLQDWPVPQIRSVVGPDMLLGISASTVAQARNAAEMGADYIGYGPVFPTGSKTDADPPTFVSGLREARNIVNKPFIAIGGITEDNAQEVTEVLNPDTDGLAVISAVFLAQDPVAAAYNLARIAKNRL